MFTEDDFSRLLFLLGRWSGISHDGSVFYEEYESPEPHRLRTLRFEDDTFSEPTDSSTIVLADGNIVARWGDHVWHAVEVGDGRACFRPVTAPTSFCWDRLDADTVQVRQRWVAGDTPEQELVVRLNRLRS